VVDSYWKEKVISSGSLRVLLIRVLEITNNIGYGLFGIKYPNLQKDLDSINVFFFLDQE
jgi:hypothetical protein